MKMIRIWCNFGSNIDFVKNAIQYVQVHMNKLLQTRRFHWKYDHIIIVLVLN